MQLIWLIRLSKLWEEAYTERDPSFVLNYERKVLVFHCFLPALLIVEMKKLYLTGDKQ